jgi:hypothetical protein
MTLTYVLRGPKTLIVRNKIFTAVNSKSGLVDDTSLSISVVRMDMCIGGEGSVFRKQPRRVCDTYMTDRRP